jgi:hypothetical protein
MKQKYPQFLTDIQKFANIHDKRCQSSLQMNHTNLSTGGDGSSPIQHDVTSLETNTKNQQSTIRAPKIRSINSRTHIV